jgi:hypothetical protein
MMRRRDGATKRQSRVGLSCAGVAGLACLGLAACSGGGTAPAAPSATPIPTPAPTPEATARYSVTFEATWGAQSHPVEFPAGPHFSRLVGGTHSEASRFWEPGGLASDAIEAMAEQGDPAPLADAVDAAARAGSAQHVLRGEGIALSPGSVSLEFEIGRDFPLVTLVSMLAPSPDWFAGVHDLNLVVDGTSWAAERVVTLDAYDAGTDSGATYASADRDTQPREPIQRIEGPPLEANGGVAPVGRLVFRRLE